MRQTHTQRCKATSKLHCSGQDRCAPPCVCSLAHVRTHTRAEGGEPLSGKMTGTWEQFALERGRKERSRGGRLTLAVFVSLTRCICDPRMLRGELQPRAAWAPPAPPQPPAPAFSQHPGRRASVSTEDSRPLPSCVILGETLAFSALFSF